MSLQVWLPMTEDLRNQGLSDVTITNYGATLNAVGKLGGCYYFDGVDDRITIKGLTLSNVWSYGCWVYADTSTRGWEGVIVLSDTGSDGVTQMGFLMYPNGNRIQNTANGQWNSQIGWAYGSWHHFFGTFDGSSLKTYIDGELINTKNITASLISRANLVIGARTTNIDSTGASLFFQGKISDVRIYDHCLSQMEVKRISRGLILHYPLNNMGFGQENLYGYGSDLQTTLSGLNNYNNSFSIIEEEGKKCAHVSGALKTTKYLQSKLTYTPSIMEQFTFSAEVKIKNIVRGTTNPMCEFYFSGATIDSAWRGFVVDYIHVDGAKVGVTAIGFDRYLTDTAWHKVAVTAHFNYNGTSTIPALMPNIYLRDCTGDLYIRNVKFEKGSVATPWSPAPSDTLADTMGLNSNIEYDSSGYCHNGIKNNITYVSDTPKYAVSSVFNGSNSYIKVNDNNWMTKGMPEMTVNFWAKATTWPANGGRLLSCTESGGFNLEAGKSGYWRFEIYVYTNSEQTSAAYKNDSSEIKIADLIPNEWNMITLVYESSGTKTYINGELHHTYINTSYGISFNTNARLFLGCEANTANPSAPYFNGMESDFRIYATALSATDVKSLYQNSATIDADGTIHGAIR